jgi:crossover junction endodeoxyribonuclease RuvC
MIILGVDPGTRITGYAIVSHNAGKVALIACDPIKLGAQDELVARVGRFYATMEKLIVAHSVSDIALETSFLGKNPSNFLKLGYLRGALYVLAHRHNLTIHEYSPMQIKLQVTGLGSADKEQVSRMVHRLFPGLSPIASRDATDALAVALTCSLLCRVENLSRQFSRT